MKIIFMGSPDFATPTLQELISSNHEVVAVFSAPPKPKNRGMKLTRSPIHELATQNHIEVFTPTSLKSTDTLNIIESIDADIIIVVAYGFIIPQNILGSKKYGCLNLHPSALPRWRGAAPLQRTIIAGDSKTEICIMQMDEGLDTGDILLSKELELDDQITLQELHDKCASIGAKLMKNTLDNIANIKPRKQSESEITYADKLSKQESSIDWSESAFAIDCKIRGMNPWPGVCFKHKENIIKIRKASYLDITHQYSNGEILNLEMSVACGSGILKILEMQLPNKAAQKTEDFLKAYKFKIGEILQ